jgi:omega-6 fatty acid desaturase (delta-12 desaturase)
MVLLQRVRRGLPSLPRALHMVYLPHSPYFVYLRSSSRVNHWLVLITFLQHTDPLIPHYRAPEFTFPRGALSTLDRKLFGDLGAIPAWLGATLTHGISETHVLHHVSSKIPHYNAWEASAALRQRLQRSGIVLDGGAAGWAEVYRCFRECKVVSFIDTYMCHMLNIICLLVR